MINFFKQIKQLFIDIKNRKAFKLEISSELDDPNSKLNLFEVKADNEYTSLSTVLIIPEEYQQGGTEVDIMHKLQEMARPITSYVCYELGWAEYISVPEFYYLDDPSQPNMSRAYLATWNYMPMVLDNSSFWIKLTCFAAFCLACVAGGITALCLLA